MESKERQVDIKVVSRQVGWQVGKQAGRQVDVNKALREK
jgi:hypothetical protein